MTYRFSVFSPVRVGHYLITFLSLGMLTASMANDLSLLDAHQLSIECEPQDNQTLSFNNIDSSAPSLYLVDKGGKSIIIDDLVFQNAKFLYPDLSLVQLSSSELQPQIQKDVQNNHIISSVFFNFYSKTRNLVSVAVFGPDQVFHNDAGTTAEEYGYMNASAMVYLDGDVQVSLTSCRFGVSHGDLQSSVIRM